MLAEFAKLAGTSDDQRIVEQIGEEANAMLVGRPVMDLRESMSFWTYARLRTDLEKEESKLTTSERIWKQLYLSLDTEINKNFELEAGVLEGIQNAELTVIKATKDAATKFLPEHLTVIRDKIAVAYEKMEACIIVHFDKESAYQKAHDSIWEKMTTASDKNEVLKLVTILKEILDKYKEALVDRLIEETGAVSEWLYILGVVVSKVSDPVTSPVVEKWYELCRSYFIKKRIEVSAVIAGYNVDKHLVESIISSGGDMKKTSDGVPDVLANYGLLMTSISSQSENTQKIREQRIALENKLFGQSEEKKTSSNLSSKTNSSTTVKRKFDFDPRRFLKTIFTLYVIGVLFGLFIQPSGGDSSGFVFAFPILILFMGGFIPALIFGFVVYCGWFAWEQRTALITQ